MKERLIKIRQHIGREKFKLLISMIKDDIKFHKSIGTNYTEESVLQLIDNAFMIVESL